MKKPVRKDEGVSEVVGSILTLSITVTLFAAIFLSMNNLPAPTGRTYADFQIEAKQVTLSNGTTATWVNLTHKGGEVLKDSNTAIYLISSSNPTSAVTYTFSIQDGFSSQKTDWKPGETWSKLIYDNGNIDINTAYLLVVDTSRSTVIWRGDLASGITEPLPPIIMDRGTTPDPVSRSSTFRFYVYIKDPNLDFDPDHGDGSLTVSFPSELHLYSSGNPVTSVTLTHDIGYRYISPELNASSRTPVGTHIAEIRATDAHNNTAKDYLRFVIETPTTEDCDIYIAQISFSPSSPVTGETTRITVTFANSGNSYGYCIPQIYDELPNGTTLRISPEGAGVVYISAHGESTRTYTWNSQTPILYNNGTQTGSYHPPSPAGNHNITISAVVPEDSPEDSNLTNNNMTEPLTIIPKILLVDDDHNRDFNTVSYMMEALNATGYSYDTYTVAYDTDSGPQYPTLNKYDVVIWMTGLDSQNSLTTDPYTGDVKNLEDFLNDGGKLWLIGENIMNNGNLATFMNTYMGVSAVNLDQALPSLVNGSAPTLAGLDNISMQSTGYRNGEYTDYIAPSGADANIALSDSSGNVIAVSNNPGNYATMFFSFEFSTIKYASDRAQIAYRVLLWLSGISGKTGRDVAIGGVTMDPEYPLYRDRVNITINVRNNGWENESVRVQLLIDGVDVSLNYTVVDVERNGGVNITWGLWYANSLGEHTLVARVDPYNEIDESDETNNVMIFQFIVRFRTLIVDDDNSLNNGGTADDWTWPIKDSFAHLLSSRSPNSDYLQTADIWVVSGANGPPSYSDMSRYNAVIWVTGSDSTNSFTDADISNIWEYLNGSGMLWIIGSGFIDNLAGGGINQQKVANFLNALGIQSYSMDASSGFTELIGRLNDEIGHGIDFTMDSTLTSDADSLVPVSGADWVFSGNGGYVGIKYSHGYKTVIFTFNLNATTGLANYYSNPHFPVPSDIANRTRYEITYLVMHWFGQINTNPEMKVGADLYVNGEPIDRAHLVLGNSYILEAKIHNVGSEDIIYANVRFYDGNHIIDSSSVGISAGNVSTVSVVWKPSYAGLSRPIRVIVDYNEEVQEIPDPSNLSKNLFEYNNEAVHYVPVYFFWDDMENGSANWMHEATVVNINGESPIDFLGAGYNTVYTNVIHQWNDSLSSGGKWIDTVFHSYNRSYWLEEPSPTGVPIDQVTTQTIPLDVVFALDTSGSMSGTPIQNLKQATKDFILNLTDKDRAKVWIFNGGGSTLTAAPELLFDWMYMTDANKTIAINQIDSITAGGYTPFYDTLGKAIESAVEFDSNCSNHNRLEVVIGMTDGESNSDKEWSPHADWGSTVTESTYSPGTYTKKGLIKAPPLVFTIGLGVTHDSNYPTAPDWSHTYSPSGSVEYDLWNCADKTPWPWGKYGRDFNKSSLGYNAMPEFNDPDPHIGHYYYTTDSSQLGEIFTSIRELVQTIASGSGQAAGNGNVTRSVDLLPISAGVGTRSSLPNPTPNIVETRYMRSDTQSTNGLSAYILGTTQSSSYTYTYIGYGTAYAGIRVYVRHADGTEDEITPGYAVAVAYTTSSGALVSGTWSCPETSLSPTDSIVVRVYAEDDDSTPDELAATFITEQLGAIRLDASTWTVYYYLDGYRYDYFFWGDSTHNSRIEGFSYTTSPPSKPGVLKAYPDDGKIALPSQYVAVIFNKSMDTSVTPTLTQTGGSDPDNWTFEGWFTTYNTDDTAIWSHDNWSAGDTITLTVSNYVESSGTYTGDPYTWSFNIFQFTGAPSPPQGTQTNTNKTAVTLPFDLSNVESAVLTFWHKYSIVPGMNGAFLELGYKDASNPTGPWKWNYMIPAEGAYTGNLNLSATRTDSDGTQIVWGWNGVSGKGTFTWEFVKVNLLNWIPANADRSQICIKFNYTQYGLGTGYGWYIDDVKVIVSRSDSNSPTSGDSDVWQIVETTDRNGNPTHAWWNGDPTGTYFKPGIDNSLISRPIDLTNAMSVHLSAYFKFNINTSSGAPPDGFRVEISKDGGVTWTPINLGVRSAWGVSGTDNSASQTITGVDAGNYWVEAGSLTRLNVDLTAFRGNVIMIRFRVVTTSAATYQHYDTATGWGGFYLDDVVIYGDSLGA